MATVFAGEMVDWDRELLTNPLAHEVVITPSDYGTHAVGSEVTIVNNFTAKSSEQ